MSPARPPWTSALAWLLVCTFAQSCSCGSKPAARQAPDKPAAPATKAAAPAQKARLRLGTDLDAAALRPALDTFAGEAQIALEVVKPDAPQADVWLVSSPTLLDGRSLAPLPPALSEHVAPWAKVGGVPWISAAARIRGVVHAEQGELEGYRETGLKSLIDAQSIAWCSRCPDTQQHLGLLAGRWGPERLGELLTRLKSVGRDYPTAATAVAAVDKGQHQAAWVTLDNPWCRSARAHVVGIERSPANAAIPVAVAVAQGRASARLSHDFVRFLIEHHEPQEAYRRLCLVPTAEGAGAPDLLHESETQALLIGDPAKAQRAGRAALERGAAR